MLLPILVALLLPQAALTAGPQYATVRASSAAETPKKSAGSTKKKKKIIVRAATKRVATAGKASASAIGFTTPSSAGALSSDLGTMIDRAARGATWGVLVVSLTNGDTLFTRNADVQLLPASTMKLFTSSLALERFGSNGRFETEVLRAGAIGSDGILRGDLVLKGAGDPTLAGRSIDSAAEPPMMLLAHQIAASGVKRVSGGIIADASAFEDRHVPDGWRTRYLGASYAARVSALSFNENKITVIVRPVGGHAEISFQPAVTGVPLSNEVTVTPGSQSSRIRVRQDSSGKFAVTGWIGANAAPRDYQYVVEAPELFAGGALRAALSNVGVTVEGPVRLAKAPAGSPRLAVLESPRLEDIVRQMNGESNNHFAELLFRNAAHSTGVAGSAENGNVLLRRFLYEKANISPTSVFAADGSGLSTLDRVTPRAMVGLLGYAQKAVWGTVLESSLPIAGQTETLRHRMRYTPAMGNLHAKTGTTNDVASLGGYVTAKNGEKLAFSFIYNGRDRWRAKEAMDAMGATLASFSR